MLKMLFLEEGTPLWKKAIWGMQYDMSGLYVYSLFSEWDGHAAIQKYAWLNLTVLEFGTMWNPKKSLET